MGYKYQDVLSLEPIEDKNLTTQVHAMKAVLTFDFRDWLWLSNVQRFQQDITDPEVLSGEQEG